MVTKVKLQVDDALDISGAAVVPDGDPEAGYPSWGEEDVLAVFKPLLIPPQVTINSEVDELDIDYQDLDSDTVRVIQKRVKAKLDKNREHLTPTRVSS